MKQHYTQTFKNKVLGFAETNGANKAAEKFEVSIQTVRNWKQKLSPMRSQASAPDGDVRVVLTLSRANARDIARQYLADTLVNDKPI